MNTTPIPIRNGPITGNVTHCMNISAPPPLPFESEQKQSSTYHIHRISDHVAKRFKITLDYMRSPRRTQAIAWPRQIAMCIIYQTTGCDLKEVGKFFGLSHNAVFHARTTVQDRMDTEPGTRTLVESLIKELA